MSIVVVADDFTGAAELAGAAAEMGARAEVQTSFVPTCTADVIAVDTDSRLMPPADAAHVVEAVTHAAIDAGAQWLYKKTDSVLRGNVRAEIEAMMKAAGHPRALLVPANPSKGRIIRDGKYFIDTVPLAETSFAVDPYHPRDSSDVMELLSVTGSTPIVRLGLHDDHLTGGIGVPDIHTAEDVCRRAASLDPASLPAGGVDFFQALLSERLTGTSLGAVTVQLRRPALFVCGSRWAWEQGRSDFCARYNMPVLCMPDYLHASHAASDELIESWSQLLSNALSTTGCAMAAIGTSPNNEGNAAPPSVLAQRLAAAVAGALRRHFVFTLCVEGGATAAALAGEMGWTRLTAFPSSKLPGLSALRPVATGQPLLLVKPGSYPWPQQLWEKLK